MSSAQRQNLQAPSLPGCDAGQAEVIVRRGLCGIAHSWGAKCVDSGHAAGAGQLLACSGNVSQRSAQRVARKNDRLDRSVSSTACTEACHQGRDLRHKSHDKRQE